MSAAHESWEGMPSGTEVIFSPAELVQSVQVMAYRSEKFLTGRISEIGSETTLTTEDGSSATLTWRALHLYEEDGSYEGERYVYNLQVAHTLENMLPVELQELINKEGDELPDPDIIEEIEIDYELEFYFDQQGKLEWCEERTYDVTFADPRIYEEAGRFIEGTTSDEEADEEAVPVLHKSYNIKLGEHFIEAEKRREKPDNVTPLNDDFVSFLSTVGLNGMFQDIYLQKATTLYKLIEQGHDADVELEDCFPTDVVTAIRTGFNNPT